ncbi:MAG: hypothetical protein BWY03_00585 [Parcubacteria group bacterium ADurb.Bin159]|jgi:hypothetical protein|nr:MAG: hypothetical protein BWY03_00585 [Parcubacteria group bacterium ADurb.Bin159]
MTSDKEIEKITQELEIIFTSFIKRVSFFEVLKKEYIPEGLKPHTRSICWLAEQVILQNVKKFSSDLGISDFEYPESDLSPWDVKFKVNNSISKKDIFINIKVSDSSKPIRKNDIASVKSLLNFYRQNNDPLIYFVVLKLKFDNNLIHFVEPVTVRYYPWVKDFVVNPRNEHLQSFYEIDIEKRTTAEFLKILKSKAKEKGLKI